MSAAEDQFEAFWRVLGPGIHAFEREHRFAPPRRWRFDFADVGQKIAVEIEGGVYTRGRHTRGDGFENDAEKYNAATALGWRVFRYTPGMIAADPAGVVEQVTGAMVR